ncbi:hypothetical protein P153DRAFT_313595 [Dothidotthia symphoricarpi CBS 119687]|uniref:C2H2-type domain-containing protein n=1 Tax=Dothidotthia symphoricarpi CBS 119687 TaxID=1392245 RepID=A0A6A6AGV4_9PLEO|nr:uncharacterized protein P153DRAFT_313595 [Dothidotthia symphoricarpi CBS 119687]KAF2131169.1 hypothetical protein P153DRAFT_313595 [Dothidotthia symphoricarpi CBS 119687]
MAMHLASMVHGSVRERDVFQQPAHPVYYQHTQPRAYPVSTPAYTALDDYHHQQRQRPQSPPSPPAEEQKPSLPSISALLEFAGGEKAASETAGQSPRSQRHSTSPQIRQAQHRGAGAMQQPQQLPTSRVEQPNTYSHAPTLLNTSRMTLPPTPPMHPDATGDGNQSPSTISTHSAASTPYFMGGSLNNMEPHHQRQSISSMPLSMKRDSLPSHSMSPYGSSMYAQSPYLSSPGAASTTSFYSPEQHSYNGLYAQRPLPSNYQPTMPLPVPVPTPSANGSNPWQHHHYISTSSQSAFPQSQDRYICSTCNKAFSRPSSLRIHSHSHTGEKPYKCPQSGCGKAFSVRSNMKRHERGCHAATSTTITT